MRDRMERFVILPFSIGCVSQSSVAVSDNTQPKKSHGAEANPSPKASPEGENLEGEKTKSSSGFLPLPRRNISTGLHRLVVKGFKGLSQLFTVSMEEDEEEVEVEMEIGFPTDVKHVAHIGLDGTTGVLAPAAKGGSAWDMGGAAPELVSLPSISFRQFELAMTAQADAPLAAASRLA
ncbi:hypothetical protein Taro_028423 [Colocasia esculenta]|uniref:CRIB domain-containing protein n=1 Tax=Colocasia esculenta TaxID=4460 RepID=A0A843VX87_COLES|nr:hypothetical protein [Colocasia esculenta]